MTGLGDTAGLTVPAGVGVSRLAAAVFATDSAGRFGTAGAAPGLASWVGSGLSGCASETAAAGLVLPATGMGWYQKKYPDAASPASIPTASEPDRVATVDVRSHLSRTCLEYK